VSSTKGMWHDWMKACDGDLIAVVRIPSGLSRMNCCSTGIWPSAWTARRYIVGGGCIEKREELSCVEEVGYILVCPALYFICHMGKFGCSAHSSCHRVSVLLDW
jgi:hypothetical protein